MKIKINRDKPFHLSLGRRGEMVAWGFLTRNGYRILEKNFRCPIGEIDVIAVKQRRIAFIEVKTRAGEDYGRPEEAVHQVKRKKLTQLAKWYLKQTGQSEKPAYFAVVAVAWHGAGEPEIHLIENAFDAEDGRSE